MAYNDIRGKASAKGLLESAIRASIPQRKQTQPVEDPWSRLDRYTTTRDRLEAERKEQAAQQEALSAPKLTTAEVIWNELGHRSTDIPLNGAGVIRAAFASLARADGSPFRGEDVILHDVDGQGSSQPRSM